MFSMLATFSMLGRACWINKRTRWNQQKQFWFSDTILYQKVSWVCAKYGAAF